MTYEGSYHHNGSLDEIILTWSASYIHNRSSVCTASITNAHGRRITTRRTVASLTATRYHNTTFKEIIPWSSGAEELPHSFESDVHVKNRWETGFWTTCWIFTVVSNRHIVVITQQKRRSSESSRISLVQWIEAAWRYSLDLSAASTRRIILSFWIGCESDSVSVVACFNESGLPLLAAPSRCYIWVGCHSPGDWISAFSRVPFSALSFSCCTLPSCSKSSTEKGWQNAHTLMVHRCISVYQPPNYRSQLGSSRQFSESIFLTQFLCQAIMYPENFEGAQVIVGSMNIGYQSQA